jgi:type IV fimbrial biogenesis protein FimT
LVKQNSETMRFYLAIIENEAEMKRSHGFTTIELLIAVTIVAILATIAAPSFRDYINKSHVRGAAEAVYEQLQYARSQALKRSIPIVVDFSANNSTTWALGMTDDPAGCDASDVVTDPDPCVVEYDNDTTVDFDGDGNPTDPILMRLEGEDFTNVTMKAGSGGASPSFNTSAIGNCPALGGTVACFEPIRGLARATTDHIELEKGGYRLQLRVDQAGKVKICFPSDARYFAGYTKCEP